MVIFSGLADGEKLTSNEKEIIKAAQTLGNKYTINKLREIAFNVENSEDADLLMLLAKSIEQIININEKENQQ